MASSSHNMKSMVKVSNTFGFSLFSTLSENDSAISPPCIASTLSLLAAGATGKAASEFKTVLPEYVMQPSTSNDTSVKIQSSAAAWFKIKKVKQSFREVTRANGAEIRRLPKSVDEVNAWVSNVTNGKIDQVLSELPPDLSVLLTSAIFFKADWTTKFSPKKTRNADFKIGDGNVVPVRMMTLTGKKFPYARVTIPKDKTDMNVDVVELPYGENKEFAATFVVTPDHELGVDKVVKALGEQGTKLWDNWIRKLNEFSMDRLGLPRFKLDYSPQSLVDAITNLGLKSMFVPNFNDPPFSGISDDRLLFVSDIHHKATIEVTEEGTVASATAFALIRSSLPKTATILMDRPFLFAIRNTRTRQILFLGRVDRPVNPKED